MRALITGITGFVGQYLAAHLIESGDQVRGTTSRHSWNAEVPPEVCDHVALDQWNLAEPLGSDLRASIEQFAPDCIFHLAAISAPGECGSSEPTPLAQAVNVGGTQAVIELAASLAPKPRILVTSSSHVYAPVSPDSPCVSEAAAVGPTRAYGKTKLQAEELCQRAVAEGMEVVVVRAFQHTGPRQLPKFMLPEWAEQLAIPSEEPVQVVNLDSYLDLSDVRDVVRAYRLLLATQTSRGTYNVGSGKAVRSGDVFQRLLQLSGQRRSVVEKSPGVRQHPIADITRLVRDTGWGPQLSLDQTITDTLSYFQQHSDT